jgi:hypothetical protein
VPPVAGGGPPLEPAEPPQATMKDMAIHTIEAAKAVTKAETTGRTCTPRREASAF